eukprot:scaffold32935_cov22-Cyclotella_meneghiniana.AAC.1
MGCSAPEFLRHRDGHDNALLIIKISLLYSSLNSASWSSQEHFRSRQIFLLGIGFYSLEDKNTEANHNQDLHSHPDIGQFRR